MPENLSRNGAYSHFAARGCDPQADGLPENNLIGYKVAVSLHNSKRSDVPDRKTKRLQEKLYGEIALCDYNTTNGFLCVGSGTSEKMTQVRDVMIGSDSHGPRIPRPLNDHESVMTVSYCLLAPQINSATENRFHNPQLPQLQPRLLG